MEAEKKDNQFDVTQAHFGEEFAAERPIHLMGGIKRRAGWLDRWREADLERKQKLATIGAGMDLSSAAIHVQLQGDASKDTRLRLYAKLLHQEVWDNARVRWEVVEASAQPSGKPKVAVHLALDQQLEQQASTSGAPHEAYQIETTAEEVRITGASLRGLLFGVGRLLREMRMHYEEKYSSAMINICTLGSDSLSILSSPKYNMRQHQIAFRPKTNTYDAFSLKQMRREILELAFFGGNAVEVIPPGLDDADQSPNFENTWMESIADVSKWCDELDIKFSMWYPPYFVDYDKAETQKNARAHLDHILGALTRCDVLFIPGGDPGGREPAEFFPIAKMLGDWYREKFPGGEVWVSSQFGLSVTYDLGIEPWNPVERELEWFAELHKPEVQAWLTGAVYGPWSSCPIDEFRQHLPAAMPLRHYADMCHVLTCELPVDQWDLAFAATQHREPIIVRPMTFAKIIDDQAEHTIGFGNYSEGVSDDINKYTYNYLHWGADTRGPTASMAGDSAALVRVMLEQYSRLLVGMVSSYKPLTDGILGLERNWTGELRSNRSVEQTLATFQAVEAEMLPRHHFKWRWNALLFRAYHDAFVKQRLVQEEAAIDEAKAVLTGESDESDGGSGSGSGSGSGEGTGSNGGGRKKAKKTANGHHHQQPQQPQPQGALISRAAMERALAILERPYAEAPMSSSTPLGVDALGEGGRGSVSGLYAKLHALAGMLRMGIGLQLTLNYGGQHAQRGAFFSLAWAPVSDLPFVRRELRDALGLGAEEGDDDERAAAAAGGGGGKRKRAAAEAAAASAAATAGGAGQHKAASDRLRAQVLDYASPAGYDTLWYGSFGEWTASGSAADKIAMSDVLHPHRPVTLGEDPTFFERPYQDFLDTTNYDIMEKMLAGRVRRSWRTWVVPVWPRSAQLKLRFPLAKLRESEGWADGAPVHVRITYAGADLYKLGGDWAELGTLSFPSKLTANGHELHGFMEPLKETGTLTYQLPPQALQGDHEALELIVEPREPSKVAFRRTGFPVVELWLLVGDGKEAAAEP